MQKDGLNPVDINTPKIKMLYVRKRDNPLQQYLIQPEPDLRPLKKWLIDNLSVRCYTWKELTELLREEVWLNKHLWQIIVELRDAKQLTATGFSGRFSQKANPMLCLG